MFLLLLSNYQLHWNNYICTNKKNQEMLQLVKGKVPTSKLFYCICEIDLYLSQRGSPQWPSDDYSTVLVRYVFLALPPPPPWFIPTVNHPPFFLSHLASHPTHLFLLIWNTDLGVLAIQSSVAHS